MSSVLPSSVAQPQYIAAVAVAVPDPTPFLWAKFKKLYIYLL
jgi:hypothetical protein